MRKSMRHILLIFILFFCSCATKMVNDVANERKIIDFQRSIVDISYSQENLWICISGESEYNFKYEFDKLDKQNKFIKEALFDICGNPTNSIIYGYCDNDATLPCYTIDSKYRILTLYQDENKEPISFAGFDISGSENKKYNILKILSLPFDIVTFPIQLVFLVKCYPDCS